VLITSVKMTIFSVSLPGAGEAVSPGDGGRSGEQGSAVDSGHAGFDHRHRRDQDGGTSSVAAGQHGEVRRELGGITAVSI
jgi:hypothetical protein